MYQLSLNPVQYIMMLPLFAFIDGWNAILIKLSNQQMGVMLYSVIFKVIYHTQLSPLQCDWKKNSSYLVMTIMYVQIVNVIWHIKINIWTATLSMIEIFHVQFCNVDIVSNLIGVFCHLSKSCPTILNVKHLFFHDNIYHSGSMSPLNL